MEAELSTPSQVGSKKLWSPPNYMRKVRQREKAPKVNQGGSPWQRKLQKGTGAPKGGNEEGIKMKDHS